ncbi:MAG: TolC family protein, partial [Desulfobacterales bacterium]|nr:TolC family protein [Desulfobacterales bacterium]
MLKILVSIFLSILFTSSAYSITVDEAVEFGLKNNPDLQAFRLEEEVIKGQEIKARLPLRFNPTIESNIATKGKSPIEEGSKRFTDYGVKVSQEFEIAGQRGFRIGIAERDLGRVRLEIKNRERILISEVKDAFAKTIASKEKIELTKEVIRIQERLLDSTRTKLQAGEVSGLQVNLAEVEFSKAKRELLVAENEYRESLLTLQGLLGLKPDLTLSLEGTLPGEVFALPEKGLLLESALSNRPDILAALAEVDSTKTAVELAGREAVPNLTVSGLYEKDESRNIFGIEFSVPIPFFDRKQAERREALARAQQARTRQSGLQKIIPIEIEEAYAHLSSALRELSLFKDEILSKALESLGLLNLAFKEGKIGFFDVRLGQKDTLESQFSYLDVQLRTRLAINALERAI